MKWFCGLSNVLSASEDMDCSDPQLARKHFRPNKASDGENVDVGVGGKWDALLYVKDADYLGLVSTMAESWEIREVNDLEDMAIKYNVASGKKMAQLRKQIKAGTLSVDEHRQKLAKRLAPILALHEENEKLKRNA